MSKPELAQTLPVIELAGATVSAYVSHNALPATELPALITRVYAALANIRAATMADVPVASPQAASEISASIRYDWLVSFIDGRSHKSLKRLTARGLDPRGYRKRYGLHVEYPMVAPNYAKLRAALARRAMYRDEAT